MSRIECDPDLRESLETLETCLETPLVPGELITWCGAIERAAVESSGALRRAVEHTHRQQFKDMVREDPGLLQRAERLKPTDGQLLASFDEFCVKLEALRGKAARAEPDERLVETELAEIVNTGLTLVIEIRKQEIALATWLNEAYQRDIGSGD